jgi:NDP-sugar pyrophosphorylase family protein
MKVFILCGSLETRISDEINKTHKPMVKIGSLLILAHIIRIYKNNYQNYLKSNFDLMSYSIN